MERFGGFGERSRRVCFSRTKQKQNISLRPHPALLLRLLVPLPWLLLATPYLLSIEWSLGSGSVAWIVFGCVLDPCFLETDVRTAPSALVSISFRNFALIQEKKKIVCRWENNGSGARGLPIVSIENCIFVCFWYKFCLLSACFHDTQALFVVCWVWSILRRFESSKRGSNYLKFEELLENHVVAVQRNSSFKRHFVCV